MIRVYINRPNPHMSVHRENQCNEFQKHRKTMQRLIIIDANSISRELHAFRSGQYTFGTTSSDNDMWIQINFDDVDFEIAVYSYIRRLIGAQNPALYQCQEINHCF